MGEGYHATIEWGFWKVIKYFLILAAVCIVGTWIGTRLLNWDVAVVMYLWTNPVWFIPLTLIPAGALLIRSRMGNSKPKTQKQTQLRGQELEMQRFFQAHPEINTWYDKQGRKYVRQ